MTSFIRNIWYVAAWSHEVSDAPVGRQVIDQPIVLWRGPDGRCVAMEDRCPHRQAPLSLGRVEGGLIRCMYHGLRFDETGRCVSVPATERIPTNSTVRTYPLEERDSWLWVWLGDPALADPALIPTAFGLDGPWGMTNGVIDYNANYMLVNDNLTDLSHTDFTHEKTIAANSKTCWSDKEPQVETVDNGVRLTRWLFNPTQEMFNAYLYLLPGVLIMRTRLFPAGTAESVNFGDPGDLKGFHEQVDQQAITPVSEGRSRYFYAAGAARDTVTPDMLEGMGQFFTVAFSEDREMIEAQQRNWDRLGSDRPMSFIPQDKAPYLIRRMIAQRIEAEAKASQQMAAAE